MACSDRGLDDSKAVFSFAGSGGSDRYAVLAQIPIGYIDRPTIEVIRADERQRARPIGNLVINHALNKATGARGKALQDHHLAELSDVLAVHSGEDSPCCHHTTKGR